MRTYILYPLLFIALLFGACHALKKVDTFQLTIGMSKDEAIQALKKKPDNIIGAKQYEDGLLEVVQFSGLAPLTTEEEMEKYWLYFFNDRLVEWGQPMDWELETERIYRLRKKEFMRP